MKNLLLGLGLFGAFAGVASAQTSVTVYGVADAGIEYSKNLTGADNLWRLQSGQQSGSRLGFRGTENLGGGMSAIFTLESGVNIDNGQLAQNGGLFGRQAWVGLNGGFGAIKMGRQQTPLYFAVNEIDPFKIGLAGNAQRALGYGLYNVDPLLRTNNTINYSTPNFGGFSANASWGFGEVAGSTSTGRQLDAGLAYANGPIRAHLAYHDSNDFAFPVTTPAGGFAALGAGVSDLRTVFLGGTYDFGVATAHLAFADTKSETAALDVKIRNYLIGASAKVGTGLVMASWNRNDVRDISEGVSNQYAIGYSYPLSKRTNLYTSFAITKNDDAVRLNAFANGETGRIVNVGMRHVF
jgi:predicted porin